MSEANITPNVAPVESSVGSEISESTSVENGSIEMSGVDEFGGFEDQLDVSNEESIDNAQKNNEISAAEAKQLKKQLKIKVDGEELIEELNFDDEEGLKKHLQKSKAFDKRSKEFSEYKSQVDMLLQMLKDDPEGLLEKLGHNVDELSEKRLSRKIEEMKKSPEQIEAEKMRKKLEEYEKREKELEERAKLAEAEKMRNEQASKIQEDIQAALENGNYILPKNDPDVLSDVAKLMISAMKAGYHNVEVKDVIPLLDKRYRNFMSKVLGNSSDDVLESLASKDRLNNYRKAQVQQRKNVAPVQKPKIEDTGSKGKKPEEKAPGYNMKNFFKLNPNS